MTTYIETATTAPIASAAAKPTKPARASAAKKPLLNSRSGVTALVDKAIALYEAGQLGHVFNPLFPDDYPIKSVAQALEHLPQRFKGRLDSISEAVDNYRQTLQSKSASVLSWLDASEEDIREVALHFAKLRFADKPAQYKVAWAERLLKQTIAGDNAASQFSRVSDARFWRRAIRVQLMREREHFFLHLRLIHKGGENYVSDLQLLVRFDQLRRQTKWLHETVLVPQFLDPSDCQKNLMTLADVASTAQSRFAKLYTFVKAMDAISIEQKLATALLTLTLEPEWHPNPGNGKNSWNGASPREAHNSIGKRWQSVLRDLDALGVGVSGLRVVEPHKDGCPHWHLWMLYQPAAQDVLLQTVMKYFPLKLKVRNVAAKAQAQQASQAPKRNLQQELNFKAHAQKKADLAPTPAYLNDIIYDSLESLVDNKGRAPVGNEGAQVDFVHIDRSISSGASYAMKYLLKTVDASAPVSAKKKAAKKNAPPANPVKVETEEETEEESKKRLEHKAVARRVDAYRSLWGINASQLFGVAKCLSAWDELRRLNTRPKRYQMKQLWRLARGSNKQGRIEADAGIRGNAKGFIEALGGLAASRLFQAKKEPRPSIQLGRYTQAGWNNYGDEIEKPKGLALIKRCRIKVFVINPETGELAAKAVTRTVKILVYKEITRTLKWSTAPLKFEAQEMEKAEKRFEASLTSKSTPTREPGTRRPIFSSIVTACAALGLIRA